MKKCCNMCISDNIVWEFIKDNGEKTLGNCDFNASHKNVSIIDPQKLQGLFEPIFKWYKVDNKNGLLFNKGLSIFSSKIFDNSKLISAIFPDGRYSFFLENRISFDKNKYKKEHKLKGYPEKLWYKFCKEVKNKYRFFADIDIEFDKTFDICKRPIYAGEIFFRARFNMAGKIFSKEKMGKPPRQSSENYRANVKGIPVLYLSSTRETAALEIQSYKGAILNIAEFIVEEDLNIVDLARDSTLFKSILPFKLGEDYGTYIFYRTFLCDIVFKLFIPINKDNRDIDYLPCQIISEKIKKLGYDGLGFLGINGYNLVLFKDNKVRLTRNSLYTVDDLSVIINEKDSIEYNS